MCLSSQRRRRLSKSKRREMRVRQARKAREARLHLQRHYANLPTEARAFFETLSPVFRRPTFLRFAILLVAALLTVGSRTIANVLRTVGLLAPGDPSSYHRFFSCRRWSLLGLGRCLAAWILARFVPTGPVELAADDTVDEHPGDKVYGKGCHRDAVRSSHSYTAFRWGHKWLVVFVLVSIPWATRKWALPIFVILLHSDKEDKKHKRRHQTPAQRLLQAILVLRRWFPHREFVLAADGGFASHELTSGIVRLAKKTTYVSRFYAKAALYDPPPAVVLKPNGKRPTAGRSRVKGAKRDTPEQVVAKTKERTRLKVSWYGGEDRAVEVVSGTGHWYKAGQGLVRLRWVYVHDLTGTHRDEYFYSTDEKMTAQQILETYTQRWNVETTFQEMRSYVGLETTRGWKKETVLRAAPCLFGLYSVVVCLYLMTPETYRALGGVRWTGKQEVTFSDAISAVRKWLWVEWVFASAGQKQTFENLPEDFQQLLLNGLAPAA
jgi:DDE superfamily endonuclease/Archaeal putative transposase ISC1217